MSLKKLENPYKQSKDIGALNIQLTDIYNVDDALFIKLSNNQNILMLKDKLYDLSEYSKVAKIFKLGRKLCGVFINSFTYYVVNIKTQKVLFQSDEAYFVDKNDDKTLDIIWRGIKPTSLYNIETKKYISAPDGYKFDKTLGDGLYVFCENDKYKDVRKCVINLNGEILLSDVKGYLYLHGTYLINSLKSEIKIINLKTKNIKIIKKDETILSNPNYYDGQIYTITKDKLNVLNLELESIKTYPLKNVSEVTDIELVENIFKICVPVTYKGKTVGKHYFVNLNTSEILDHLRVEGAPYWEPTTFIGYDDIILEGEDVERDYHFYDLDFKKITTIRGKNFYSDGFKERLIFITNNNEVKLLNTTTKTVCDINYDYTYFNSKNPYGYGINEKTDTLDFFDDSLNIIISGFKYKDYCPSVNDSDFSYFILNNYVCITDYFTDGYGITRWKCIIINPDGKVIFEKNGAQCFEIGNMIKIIKDNDSTFINTVTGEIGQIFIIAPSDENNKIDVNSLTNFNQLLSIKSSLVKDDFSRKLLQKNKI